MNATHLEVLRRLESFQLDSAEATLPFSARLARENQWPTHYTRRVIAEYKRFAYLAVAAGHPVSPSEDVDQAWHLHLTYTQNYWKIFCGQVLGQPFHHHPTQGGSGETAKFHEWYTRTLESYQTHFGERPPPDIWPSAAARLNQGHHHPHFVRVDRARNWILPKIRFRLALKPLAWGALVAVVALCTGSMFAQGASPLDWRGPEFLRFHLGLLAACLALAIGLRWRLRVPGPANSEDHSDLDPYAMAYLNGGKILAVNTAFANLANRHLIKIDAKGKEIVTSGLIEPQAAPLEQSIYEAAQGYRGITTAEARLAAKPSVEIILQDLQERGLMMADGPARRATWIPLLMAGFPLVLGALKIAVGVSRGKPVGLLVVISMVYLLIVLAGFARRPGRSRSGDAALAELRRRHAPSQKLRGRLAGVTSTEFATAVGLFGLVALDGTVMADLQRRLQPPSANSGDGGGCGGGCGGGGGGGGCGGCGGD